MSELLNSDARDPNMFFRVWRYRNEFHTRPDPLVFIVAIAILVVCWILVEVVNQVRVRLGGLSVPGDLLRHYDGRWKITEKTVLPYDGDWGVTEYNDNEEQFRYAFPSDN